MYQNVLLASFLLAGIFLQAQTPARKDPQAATNKDLQARTYRDLQPRTYRDPQAVTYRDPKAPVEDRVSSLLSQMTLEEKIDYIGGYEYLDIRPIPRLGLPQIYMSDGPVGIDEYGNSTAYPAGIMDAATWNVPLVNKLGVALGRDARARGVHVLLAPGVNIYRAPMCGRNFEYFGEDPYLAARMAVDYIEGLQSQKVVATVKHFVANNQEWDRHHSSSDMDERTLQEIYLPAFKAAVVEAKVGAVMNSYNLLNGTHTTQNKHLNIDILKNDWKFDGILMSDWHATYEGVPAAKYGLDLEMPSARYMNRATLVPAIRNGTLSEADIDDKVRRILRIVFRFGFFDRPQADPTIAKDNPESVQTALQVAREGIVLLKNDRQFLPLDAGRVHTIAVIGPNADRHIAGGGSSSTNPFHTVSLLQGLRGVAGPQVKIVYVPAAMSTLEEYCASAVYYAHPGSPEQGLRAEYFSYGHIGDKPDSTRTEKNILRSNDDMRNIHGLPGGNFSVRWTGVIRPERTTDYFFTVRTDQAFSLWIGDKNIMNRGGGMRRGPQTITFSGLEAGKEYPIRLEYFCMEAEPAIAFAWYPTTPDLTAAIAAARAADVVVMAMGYNENLEQENFDRPFALPGLQDSLIAAVAAVNSQTVVVLNAGGNVAMQKWLPSVGALLHAWYPGQEGGAAIAEVLFGKTNPSGKLPATFEKEWKDNPTHDSYYDEDKDGHVLYKEGLFVGYRGYEKNGVMPQWPFGFGLSYTTFAYGKLKVETARTGGSTGATGLAGRPKVLVSFDIKNTGSRDGAEVAQLYVHQQKCGVERPYKELKGFVKVFLKKGETRRVTITLSGEDFSYYKTELGKFGYDPGVFEILVGASSAEILLRGTATIL